MSGSGQAIYGFQDYITRVRSPLARKFKTWIEVKAHWRYFWRYQKIEHGPFFAIFVFKINVPFLKKKESGLNENWGFLLCTPSTTLECIGSNCWLINQLKLEWLSPDDLVEDKWTFCIVIYYFTTTFTFYFFIFIGFVEFSNYWPGKTNIWKTNNLAEGLLCEPGYCPTHPGWIGHHSITAYYIETTKPAYGRNWSKFIDLDKCSYFIVFYVWKSCSTYRFSQWFGAIYPTKCILTITVFDQNVKKYMGCFFSLAS